MALGIGLLVGAGFVIWLVFFKFHWLQWSIAWAIFSSLFVVHVFLIFFIGLRFVTPTSNNAKVVQHTIQLVPRLTEPTSVTEVLVEENQHVHKGQPLFRFDRRPYEYKVNQLEAKLAEAKQNVLVLQADVDVAEQNLAKAKSELVFAQYQQQLAQGLAEKHAGSEEDAKKWAAQLQVNEAAVKETASKPSAPNYATNRRSAE